MIFFQLIFKSSLSQLGLPRDHPWFSHVKISLANIYGFFSVTLYDDTDAIICLVLIGTVENMVDCQIKCLNLFDS